MRTLLIVLFGQLVSRIGTQLTAFGLGVSVFLETGSAGLYGLTVLVTLLPPVFIAPVAGALTDHWDRRKMLILAHAGAGACSLVLALLFHLELLEIWTILPLIAIASCFNAFEFPALSTATTVLVPAKLLGRANGLVQLCTGLSLLVAPALAGFMMTATGLGAIFVVDVTSFVFAIVVLMLIRIPSVQVDSKNHHRSRISVRQVLDSIAFIRRRSGLAALLLISVAVNFNLSIVRVLFTPLVLSLGEPQDLGWIDSFSGVGVLLGSAVMAVWGGPRRRIYAVLVFSMMQGLVLLIAVAKPSLYLAGAGSFMVLFTFPLIFGCAQTIWQQAVPVEQQGRVFSIRMMADQAAVALATSLAGPLADHLFEPLLRPGGALASVLGPFMGIGPGRGTALLIALLGMATVLVTLAGLAHRPLREVEGPVPGPS